MADYKQIRELAQYGKFYTLKAPLDSNEAAWMTVSDDQNEAVFMTVNYAQPYLTKIKLTGLDPDKNYVDLATGKVYGGDELINLGFYDPVAPHKDFAAKMYHFLSDCFLIANTSTNSIYFQNHHDFFSY